MNEGTFEYRNLVEPDDKEKLEAHVLLYPNDLIARIVLKLYNRVESLELTAADHASVVDRHRLIG